MQQETEQKNFNQTYRSYRDDNFNKTKYKFSYDNIDDNQSDDELARDWNLNGPEFVLISSFRVENRTWASFSLCLLRKYGRLPKINEKPNYDLPRFNGLT